MNFKILFFATCLFLKIYSSSADDEPAMNDYDLGHCKQTCFRKFAPESGQCSDFDKCVDCFDNCDKKFGPFLLEIVSKRNEGLLFSVNIKWDEIIMKEFKKCLVTWEIYGGGLMGNLVTDSPKVELTLWADKLYSVQVKCKNTETRILRSSYKLIVNTKSLLTVNGLKSSKSKLSDPLLNANENLETEEDMLTPINFPSNDMDNFMDQEHKNETHKTNIMMEHNGFYIYVVCVTFVLFIGSIALSIMILNLKQTIYDGKFGIENKKTVKFIVLKPIQVKHV